MPNLLLINLGTPENADTAAVRSYLREFLIDPYVIDIPDIQRWILVNLIIAPFRAFGSAKKYQKVWTEEGSPLLVHSQNLCEKVRTAFGSDWQVELGMRYGEPSIHSALKRFPKEQELIVLPLYPQYANASTRTAIEKLQTEAKNMQFQGNLKIIESFYEHPAYIEALKESARETIQEFKPDHILFSYHGIPVRHLPCAHDKERACVGTKTPCPDIDPKYPSCYRAQCYATTRALVKSLEIENWSQSFQSRLGRTPWIEPYTDLHIDTLIENGVRRLAVISPSFTADCLETLEEINLDLREEFLEKGGEEFLYLPCLNSQDVWVDAIAKVIEA